MAQERHAEAYEALARAAELDPRLGDAQQLLAETCVALGRPAEALEHYRVLVRLRPVDLQARLALGFLAVELGDAKTASEAWTVARRLAREDPKVRELEVAWSALVE